MVHLDLMPFVPLTAAAQRRNRTGFPLAERSRALHLHAAILQCLHDSNTPLGKSEELKSTTFCLES